MTGDLEPYRDPAPLPRRVVGRLLPVEPEPFDSAAAEVAGYLPPPAPAVRRIRLTGYATPRVRQHSADAVVVAYAVAALVLCLAVALVAGIVALAAWHVLHWMGT